MTVNYIVQTCPVHFNDDVFISLPVSSHNQIPNQPLLNNRNHIQNFFSRITSSFSGSLQGIDNWIGNRTRHAIGIDLKIAGQNMVHYLFDDRFIESDRGLQGSLKSHYIYIGNYIIKKMHGRFSRLQTCQYRLKTLGRELAVLRQFT